jgi:hypothetical protein
MIKGQSEGIPSYEILYSRISPDNAKYCKATLNAFDKWLKKDNHSVANPIAVLLMGLHRLNIEERLTALDSKIETTTLQFEDVEKLSTKILELIKEYNSDWLINKDIGNNTFL